MFALFHHSWRWIQLLGCAPAHSPFMWKSQDISGRVNLSVRIKASSKTHKMLRPELADNKSQSRRRPYQRNHYKLHASNLEEKGIYLINIYLFSHGMLSSTNATRAQIQQLNRKCNIFHNFSTMWKFIASPRTVLFHRRVKGHSRDYRLCIWAVILAMLLNHFTKKLTLLILYQRRRRQIVYWCSGADKLKKWKICLLRELLPPPKKESSICVTKAERGSNEELMRLLWENYGNSKASRERELVIIISHRERTSPIDHRDPFPLAP